MIKRFADWFFRRLCHPDYYPDIQGDLEEIYANLLINHSQFISDLLYLKEVLLLMRLSLIKDSYGLQNSSIMIYKNYLVIAWRGIKKYRGYSFLNIAGLTLGITVFLLSYLFVNDELSYDGFHEKKDRIFRFTNAESVNDDIRFRQGSAYSAVDIIPDEFPEVEAVTRIKHHDDYLGLPMFEYQDNSLLIERFSWTDPAIFDIFTFEFIEGSANGALDDLRSIVITDQLAERLFGDVPALGKIIIVNIDRDNDDLDLSEPYSMRVSGVIRHFPSNSTLDFDALGNIRFSNFENWSKDNWYSAGYPTYLLLNDGGSIDQMKPRLSGFVDRYFDPMIKDRLTVYLQPLTDIRLGSLPGDTQINSNRQAIWVIVIIALLVLGLACINFMNLSTARSTRRAKEVGLRKVIGAKRSQVFLQFMFESLLITYFAIGASVVLCYLLLPFFNHLMDKNLVLDSTNLRLISSLIAIGFLVGMISGIYPSIFLSSFLPSKVLKGGTGQSRRSGLIRKGLVVFQFTITMSLLISIGTIYYQMAYLQNISLDIQKDQYAFLRSKEEIYSNFETFERFKATLTAHNAIDFTSGTWSLPFGVNAPVFYYPFLPEGYNQNERVHMHLFRADHDFIRTFGIRLITGRDFSKEFPNDPTSAFILNESAIKNLNWSAEEAIGKDLEVFSGGGNSFKVGKVIGVVKDFNFLSLHQSVSPLVISMVNDERYRYIAVKVKAPNLKEATDHIESTWNGFAPKWPAELFFMEDEWRKNYEKEEQLADAVRYLTVIGVIIACLGLFGLASFTAEQKEKEIGIRKVLGASASNILRLVSGEFTWLIAIAFFLAAPLGWYYSKEWLDQFAYRIDISWLLFFLVMILSLILTMLTIGYHSVRAALSNPVEVLRSE